MSVGVSLTGSTARNTWRSEDSIPELFLSFQDVDSRNSHPQAWLEVLLLTEPVCVRV